MLQTNNPSLDKDRVSRRIRYRYDKTRKVPEWAGEEEFLHTIEGQLVALGASDEPVARVMESLPELLSLDGRDFVDCAYLTLCGQCPDEVLASYWLDQLYATGDKQLVLVRMAPPDSKIRLSGWRKLTWKVRLRHTRVMGGLVSWAEGLVRQGRTRRLLGSMQQLENARYRTLLNQLRRQAIIVDRLSKTHGDQQAHVDVLQQQLAYRQAQASSGSGMAPTVDTAGSSGEEQDFYLALEQRFRGSPENIRDLMKEHLHRIAEVPLVKEGLPVLDLGCGRGEWLSLLEEAGIPARGIDLNAVNITQARLAGLDAYFDDAIHALKKEPDASLAAITSFHLIEHLEFDALRELFRQARRTLAPGGLLLLETPNPRNVLVGSCTFYLDPTHERPLPPELIEFLAEYTGFSDVRIVPLHPVGDEMHVHEDSEAARRLNHHLYGHQDYALMATRPDGIDTREEGSSQ